ncbi:hypothetical protein QQ045_015580 [Rhodiola kirilowii]
MERVYNPEEVVKSKKRYTSMEQKKFWREEDSLKKVALQKRIWLLESQDERIWRQKLRISGLKDSDQNTKYFHRFATWRNNKKKIPSILVDGKRVEEPALVKQAARDYFSEIFRKSDTYYWIRDEMKFMSLNVDQREFLESKISEEEILGALKECDGSKAPGSDGFNLNFYKKYWCYVKEEVEGFIEEFCENGKLAKGINKTFLALISKIESPQSFCDFRPTSLVNSMYKILSKCLAKRLSYILPSLISPNQSAFIANRSILDGIMPTIQSLGNIWRQCRGAWALAQN